MNIQEKKIIIYILCYNNDTYCNAVNYYSKYTWARPIILENKDYTFEHVFWNQLKTIKSEWINCDMVGTLSHKAHLKVNIDNINNIIVNKLYTPSHYYHFARLNINVLNPRSYGVSSHPNFDKLYIELLKKFKFYDTNECLYTYFMSTPNLMITFIEWYLSICLPFIKEHPLSFIDSTYKGDVSKEKLLENFGVPYYPLLPFVLERFIPCYFDNITNKTTNITY